MQKLIVNKLKKQFIFVLTFIIIYTIFSFLPLSMNKSYAATYTYTANSNDLPNDFEQKYPGYTEVLNNMIKSHPNWTFKLYETGLDWETVINSEYQGHWSSPKNLVPSDYSSEWICSICGTREYDTSGRWYCASRGAIEHVMDPRNSITEGNVFQYLLLSNDKNITKEQVTAMASKISYLNNQDIINGIYEAANELNINPFYIIGKILQEQGSGASALCSGQGYNGQYIGYYNLFNVKASGNGTEEVILNGLKYAQEQGWNTPKKSIEGGIGLIKNYIKRGQDTLYYQKFNVTYSPYYANQYAQNIFDSQSIGQILKGYYRNAELLESSFIFEVPLYMNMPSSPVKSPSISAVEGELAYVNAIGGLALRSSPGGSTIAYVSEGAQIVITKRASAKSSDGYYWDQVSTPNGTGYMAREAKDGSKTYLVVIKQYEISGDNIIVAPGTGISAIPGATNSSSTFGTGAQINFEGKTYNLVVLGDVNGDGKIKASDYVLIKNYIMSNGSLNDVQKKAADINKDSSVKASDYVLIKNYIMYGNKITL